MVRRGPQEPGSLPLVTSGRTCASYASLSLVVLAALPVCIMTLIPWYIEKVFMILENGETGLNPLGVSRP
jgi:hypothetical protein